MPAYPTRRQITSGVPARSPRLRGSGGTTAPRSAASGARYGLGPARPAHKQRSGVGQGKAVAGPGLKGPLSGGATPPPPANVPPTPWNSKAEEIVSGARRSYLNESGNFDLAEQQAKAEFGLDPGFNDYKANPYSRAALLEQSYQNANRGTTNSAGLQLYSGSTSNALGSNRGVYSQNRDALAGAYRDALGEISTGRVKAAEERAEREREAEWERIAAAEGAELEPSAAPGPGGGGGRKGKPKGKKGGGGGKGPAVGRGRKAR